MSYQPHQPISPHFLTLSSQILHPPTHPNHIVSLYAALLSIRRCLQIEAAANHQGYEGALDASGTCRAWVMLAEIGLAVLAAGLGGDDGPDWARGIGNDVEKAIGEGLKLCSTPRSVLRAYWVHLTLLHSHLALWQHQVKFSRGILKRLRDSLNSAVDPPSVLYSVLLTWHANLLSPVPSASNSSQPSSSSSPPPLSPSEIHAALHITADLNARARENNHPTIAQLATVLRLRTLVRAEMWHARANEDPASGDSVANFLEFAERVMGLDFSSPNVPVPDATTLRPEVLSFQMHTLVVGVLYFTLVGNTKASSPRLARLHILLDASPVDSENGQFLQIDLSPAPPLTIQTTHPRTMFELAFLVSSVSKRDLVGRKPRRRVFAEEGLKVSDGVAEDVYLPVWASLGDARDLDERLAKIKADLLCEMAAIAIVRSEFEEAQQHLDRVIAHTRTYSLFPFYAARISLHQAHLAHATNQHTRALECYRVAAYLDSEQPSSGSPSNGYGGRTGGFVRMAARAGEVGLLLGLRAIQRQRRTRVNGTPAKPVSSEQAQAQNREDMALDAMAREVADECKLFPGTLAAVGKVIEAVLSSEIVRAKQRLKLALDIATGSTDNHLRALVIALTSAHYVHTASDHAQMMLATAQQLAAGMGAAPKQSEGSQSTPPSSQGQELGNAPLGLWVGERFHELYLRQGQSEKAAQCEQRNAALRSAVRALPSRSSGGASTRPSVPNRG